MPQKHDLGFIKRNNRPKPVERISGEALARKLVTLGLASGNILDHAIKPKEGNQ